MKHVNDHGYRASARTVRAEMCSIDPRKGTVKSARKASESKRLGTMTTVGWVRRRASRAGGRDPRRDGAAREWVGRIGRRPVPSLRNGAARPCRTRSWWEPGFGSPERREGSTCPSRKGPSRVDAHPADDRASSGREPCHGQTRLRVLRAENAKSHNHRNFPGRSTAQGHTRQGA